MIDASCFGIYRHTGPVLINGQAFFMHEPILYRVESEEGCKYVTVEDLDIFTEYFGENLLEDQLFSEISYILEEYGLESNDKLTGDAVALKEKVNSYFTLIRTSEDGNRYCGEREGEG